MAVVGAWMVVTAPVIVLSDGVVRLEALDSMLRSGVADPVKYSFVGPLAAAPLWYLGEAVGATDRTVWLFNRIVFLGMLLGLWFALRPVLGHGERLRLVMLLLYGSMFPWHVQYFFGEVFHVACVGLGLALVVNRDGRWGWLGWPLVVLGTANVPATIGGLALAAGVLAWHRRRWRYGLAVVAAAGLVMIENLLRRGDPLAGGYAGDHGYATVLPFSGLPGFSYPFFFGLLSILFSFGRGLIFFTPGLFLRYPPRRNEPAREADARLLYRVWVAVVVGLVLVYARWWAWYGGFAWGPRFFLFACLPAALVLARWTDQPRGRTLRANLLALTAVAMSCWVGANGLVFGLRGLDWLGANDYAFEFVGWYVPECSVLWYPFTNPLPLDILDVVRLAGFALGFVYLAGPLLVEVGRQLRQRCCGVWRSLRCGPRFRL